MKQSRGTSLLKSLVNTAVGFAVAMLANALVLPLFGWTPSLSENLVLTTIYTVISIVRGYVLERLFEAAGWRVRMSAFALAVLAERQRQINVEGWTTDHDDHERMGTLADAGAFYARWSGVADKSCSLSKVAVDPDVCLDWPWRREDFKPTNFRRDLVKGAALILAEGERFDRNRKRNRKNALTPAQSEAMPEFKVSA